MAVESTRSQNRTVTRLRSPAAAGDCRSFATSDSGMWLASRWSGPTVAVRAASPVFSALEGPDPASDSPQSGQNWKWTSPAAPQAGQVLGAGSPQAWQKLLPAISSVSQRVQRMPGPLPRISHQVASEGELSHEPRGVPGLVLALPEGELLPPVVK